MLELVAKRLIYFLVSVSRFNEGDKVKIFGSGMKWSEPKAPERLKWIAVIRFRQERARVQRSAEGW